MRYAIKMGNCIYHSSIPFKKKLFNHYLTQLALDKETIIDGTITSYMKILHSVRSKDNHQRSVALRQLHFLTLLAKNIEMA